jgi:hypothetical protein
MSSIFMQNQTGSRCGWFFRYEFGEDLFGYYYIDISKGKKHVAQKTKTYLTKDPREFIYILDCDLERKESLNYLQN